MRRRFLYAAVAEAGRSDCSYQLGAVLITNNSIVSRGHNKKGIHREAISPHIRRSNIHAEIDALRGGRISRSSFMVVVRILKDGNLANARPCKKCMQTLRSVGVGKVVYSDENGKIRSEKL